jgi:hypothetical protein
MTVRLVRENLPPKSRIRTVEKVMIPSPPHWMRSRTTHWPNKLKRFPVSTTTRPVTQVAEVAVNKASIGGSLGSAATGNISRAVPMIMIPAKLRTGMLAGVTNRWRRFVEELSVLTGLISSSEKQPITDQLSLPPLLFRFACSPLWRLFSRLPRKSMLHSPAA